MSNTKETNRPSVPNNYEVLVKMLIDARHERGLSQEVLARKIGCTESLIHKWEQFKRMPSGFMLMCWLEALEYDIEAIKR
ncbi:MAG: hypothetical protein CMB55_07730 [Euryarchaeota archaeon]|nr:hypothetical protein [Euryarchaeota archaeon]